MITPADDYPLHQTSRPFRDPGTDRNLYDRFFFNGYATAGDDAGEIFFAAAFGMYLGRNVADAAFSIIQHGVQRNVRGSRLLGTDRLDLRVGAVSIELVEPLKVVRLLVDDAEAGVRADLTFTARGSAFEEPSYRYAPGSLTVMDITRLTQNGSWSGWIENQGERTTVDPTHWRGTRDRSWGIRSVGARETNSAPDGPGPQFYWLWAPLNFDDANVILDVNETANGTRWHENAAVSPTDGGTAETGTHTYDIGWRPGTRHADTFDMSLALPSGTVDISLSSVLTFYMQGIGYGHPTWGHGMYVGEDVRSHDSFVTAEVNEADPLYNHVQILSTASRGDGAKGMGILEMLIAGRHDPSGLTGFTDMHP